VTDVADLVVIAVGRVYRSDDEWIANARSGWPHMWDVVVRAELFLGAEEDEEKPSYFPQGRFCFGISA
jgi:hypothetical protein